MLLCGPATIVTVFAAWWWWCCWCKLFSTERLLGFSLPDSLLAAGLGTRYTPLTRMDIVLGRSLKRPRFFRLQGLRIATRPGNEATGCWPVETSWRLPGREVGSRRLLLRGSSTARRLVRSRSPRKIYGLHCALLAAATVYAALDDRLILFSSIFTASLIPTEILRLNFFDCHLHFYDELWSPYSPSSFFLTFLVILDVIDYY